jgi:lysophospholipase L1-like esterase
MEQRNIFPIKPAAPVQGVNLDTIPNTLNKLRGGGNVRIAYFGDSITEGAEAGSWWNDRSKTYTGLTTAGLRGRFPSATITEFRASQGGKSLYDSQATFQTILDLDAAGQQVDVVVINLGMNDTGLSTTINNSKSALATYIDQARARGIEVIVMTPIESNPYYNPSNRAPRSVVAAAIKDVALSKDAAFLDMYQEWVNQGTRGIAPFSQLHNTYNHPGVAGMRLIADALLRMFPKT